MSITSTSTRRPSTDAALNTGWMEYGLCRQTDPNLFFPEGRGAAIAIQTEQAKQVCNRCPVRLLCLDWALDTGQNTGVWGGLSEDERRGLRGAAPHGTQFLLCLEQQEYIERRVAEGGTHRKIAEELSVGHHAVGRAWRYFEAERKQASAVAEEVAAA